MLQVLIKIIPLDIASTLSPGIFALAIFFLGNKYHPKFRTFWLFLGSLFIGIIIAIAGLKIGKMSLVSLEQRSIPAVIDIILGLIFLYFGFKLFFSKERKIKPFQLKKHEILKIFLLGLIVSATNFDAVILSFSAAKEVGSALINDINKLILLIINIIFFTLPISLPLLVYIIFPNFADRVLTKINNFVSVYSKYIVFILFIIFGIYFILKGI